VGGSDQASATTGPGGAQCQVAVDIGEKWLELVVVVSLAGSPKSSRRARGPVINMPVLGWMMRDRRGVV
jgi:hypothetical protein